MEATGVQEYIHVYNDRDKQPPARKNDLVACEQQKRRPVCTSAKSDQRLCYSLSGKV